MLFLYFCRLGFASVLPCLYASLSGPRMSDVLVYLYDLHRTLITMCLTMRVQVLAACHARRHGRSSGCPRRGGGGLVASTHRGRSVPVRDGQETKRPRDVEGEGKNVEHTGRANPTPLSVLSFLRSSSCHPSVRLGAIRQASPASHPGQRQPRWIGAPRGYQKPWWCLRSLISLVVHGTRGTDCSTVVCAR